MQLTQPHPYEESRSWREALVTGVQYVLGGAVLLVMAVIILGQSIVIVHGLGDILAGLGRLLGG